MMSVRSLLAIVALALALAGCSSAPSSGSNAARSINRGDPAAVNAAWVEALRANDVEAATGVFDRGNAEANTYDVQTYVRKMASYIYPTGKARYGAFKTVEILDVRDAGAAKRAFSKWLFEGATLCYFAELSQTDGSWSVSVWSLASINDCGA